MQRQFRARRQCTNMAGADISQNAQIYPHLDAAAAAAASEPPTKRMRTCDADGDVCEVTSVPDLRLNDVGEAVSSDNGDSGFHDIGGRCDDSSASSECDEVALLPVGEEPSSISDSSVLGSDAGNAEGSIIHAQLDDDDDDDDNNDVEYNMMNNNNNSSSGGSSSSSITSVHELRNTRDPLAWIAARMQAGVDPRPLLEQLLPPNVRLPTTIERITMWDIIIDLLGEDEEFHKPPRQRLPDVSTMDDALRLLTTCRKIVVLTGAGVSVSCGIPDFRSKNGIYARLRRDFPSLPDPQAMFDMRFFRRDPRPFFKFAREIYPGQFEPSASHRFIRGLEKRGQLLRNYTQNIDTLEHACGLQRVIACHGGFSTATCTRCGYRVDCEALRDDIFAQRVPLCPRCPQPELQHWELPETLPGAAATGGDADSDLDQPSSYLRSAGPDQMAVMKPDIVFFGEGLPEEFHRRIAEDKDDADLLIVMGSSLKVRPVASIPQLMERRVPQILINREPLAHIDPFDVQLLGDCDVVIRELCSRLDGWQHEEWLERGRPATEPPHPYTLIELTSNNEPVPNEQPFIYQVADNTYAFSGAELQSVACSSDDDDDDDDEDDDDVDDEDDSECSDSELIESLVDSLVTQVAGENFTLDDHLTNRHEQPLVSAAAAAVADGDELSLLSATAAAVEVGDGDDDEERRIGNTITWRDAGY